MNLSEMHIWFRQYAQQTGMQNVRAILPEQIDLLINTSITDTVNQIITQSIGITNDRVITDNSKIGQINALKTLYTVKSIKVFETLISNYSVVIAKDNVNFETLVSRSWQITWLDDDSFKIVLINFSVGQGVNYDINIDGKSHEQIVEDINSYINQRLVELKATHGFVPTIRITNNFDDGTTGGFYVEGTTDRNISVNLAKTREANISKTITPKERRFKLTSDGIYKAQIHCDTLDLDYLYLVDFSIDYKKSATGIKDDLVTFDTDGFTTKLFPVRLIDDAFIADTLNDFILAPKLRSPILTINAQTFDLYFDSFIKVGDGYTLDNNLVPYNLRIAYIAKPAKVAYRLDKGEDNIDCDLPEYLHIDILKHSVDLYRASISGNMLAQQAQDQNQQREIARNQAVPSDGYQRNQ